jgi:hypothetical protein
MFTVARPSAGNAWSGVVALAATVAVDGAFAAMDVLIVNGGNDLPGGSVSGRVQVTC